MVKLGPGECSNLETGARFLAALAFPAKHEDAARQDAVAAWVGQALHELNRVTGMTEPFADPSLNGFASRSAERREETLRIASRRLRERNDVARALRPWMRELLGEPQPLPKGMKKFTQRQISRFMHNDYHEDADHFQERHWRPSRPILHLAIACDLILCRLGGEESEFPITLDDIGLFEVLVERACQVGVVVSYDKRFKVDADSMLHLQWVA